VTSDDRCWPFFTVKEVLNVAESNFRFAPKADIQNIRSGADLNGCLWPKADIRTPKIDGADEINAPIARCKGSL